MTTKENVIETDVLVIGGGMAGLFAAIKARDEGVNVILVDKNYVSRSGGTGFCDGYYGVFNPELGHDLEEWKNFISQNGEYMNNPEWTEITLKESLARYQDLLSWGVEPRRGKDGQIKTISAAPPTQISAVNLHWGREYTPIIRRQAIKAGVKIMDKITVTDLLQQDERVVGAVGFSIFTGEFYVFKAKATVMSTGSGNFKQMEHVAHVAFGSFDGKAMAYRAGADISNMEFANVGLRWGHVVREYKKEERVSLEGREIHTTVADYPRTAFFFSPMALLGNCVDAEGYGNGTQFREDDLLAVHEGKGPLLVDYDGVKPEEWEWANNEYPADMDRFKKVGLDPRRVSGLWSGMGRWEYSIGHTWGGCAGISSTDTHGATSLPGLYAAGDVYHSAAIGANYPSGGTATRNASVTGARAGQAAAEFSKRVRTVKPDNLKTIKTNTYAPLERKGGFDTTWVTQQIQNNTFPYYILCIRHGDRLKAALTNVEFLQNHIAPMIYARDPHGLRLAHETKNRILAAEMMLRSSLFRKESRGKYYREDYPRRDDPKWLAFTKLKNDHGEMKLTKNNSPRKFWAEKLSAILYREKYPGRFRGEEE